MSSSSKTTKKVLAASFILGAFTSVACTQAATAPKDTDEKVASAHEALGEVGCGTVALHTPQDGGAGNDGLVQTGLVSGNCVFGTEVITSASYPGDPSCPGQAIYELDNATGPFQPSALIPSSALPTVTATSKPDDVTAAQNACSDLFVKYGVYAENPAEGGNWDLLGTEVNHLQWFPNSGPTGPSGPMGACGYGVWTGNVPFPIDMNAHPKVRVAAAAFHGVAKADPFPITYVPVAVTMNSQYCIW